LELGLFGGWGGRKGRGRGTLWECERGRGGPGTAALPACGAVKLGGIRYARATKLWRGFVSLLQATSRKMAAALVDV